MSDLRRELGVPGAIVLGLGSIVGTGLFVSIGLAAGIAGPSAVVAIAIAAVVATCNGLSSAQLAANHPVSGGTYEYGYRFLVPAAGFVAGWMFLVAKSSSAATAALGFSAYLFGALGIADGPVTLVALAAVLVIGGLVLAGLRRSTAVNAVIVGTTLAVLAVFVVVLAGPAIRNGSANLSPFFDPTEGRSSLSALLYASALMFVAYTGYGRIATLGEEVREPKRTIPKAVALTLVITMLVYVTIALVAIAAAGADAMAETAAPLEAAAFAAGRPWLAVLVTVGAVLAMIGVLLNLILGLSRVLLAMGRRRDMPSAFGVVTAGTPRTAIVVMTGVVAGLTLIGDVGFTWSFSAFTVLIYYGLTNLSALFIPKEARLFGKWVSVVGVVGCLSLAAFVPTRILLIGASLIVAGLLWYAVAARLRSAE